MGKEIKHIINIGFTQEQADKINEKIEKEVRKWFYERAFIPSDIGFLDIPCGQVLDYKSLNDLIKNFYPDEDFYIQKGIGSSIEIIFESEYINANRGTNTKRVI